jgi:hypothetical protein
MVLFYPFRFRFELDPDEGVNAIKALMVLRGYRLYDQVWNDQPPLLTFLLAAWFRLFGLRIAAGRVLVLLFSGGLMALGAGFLRKAWGVWAAVFGALALVLLPSFLQLSVSVMIGLPAIALALLSFSSLATWHRQAHDRWLVLSAAALALSILTKAFTAILAPIWLAGLIFAGRNQNLPPGASLPAWKPALIWAAAFGLLLAGGFVSTVGVENLDQLVGVHIAAGEIQESRALPSIGFYLAQSWPMLLLAGFGGARSLQRRSWTSLYLAGWAGAALIFLSINKPVWYHHQLLITIPAALLAAIAAGAALEETRTILRSRRGSPLAIAGSLATWGLILLFLTMRIPAAASSFEDRLPNFLDSPSTDPQERGLVAVLWNYAPQAEWIYTDQPMFAFVTQIPIPPELAVITKKRLVAGGLGEAEILAILEEYGPDLILDARFHLPVVQEYLRARSYRRVDDSARFRLYFRDDSP